MRLDEKDMQPKSLKGKTFGKTIQEYRLRNGWTQDELSWRTGINRTHIGRIERDECVPTVSTIERLEDAFRLPISLFPCYFPLLHLIIIVHSIKRTV